MSTSHRFAKILRFAPLPEQREPKIVLRDGEPWLLHPTRGWVRQLTPWQAEGLTYLEWHLKKDRDRVESLPIRSPDGDGLLTPEEFYRRFPKPSEPQTA